MKDQNTDYITEEKRKMLEMELTDLKGPKRKEILEALRYAKSLGDLSENAEYHRAREEQGELEGRIVKIEGILRSSQVISKVGGETVGIGSKVTVQKQGVKTEKEKMYTIVGNQESNMAEGKISNRSPLGEAMFGKKKGDSISFKTPSGVIHYKIVSVS